MGKMRLVFEISDLGEMSEMVKAFIPFKENEVRYIHFPNSKPIRDFDKVEALNAVAFNLGYGREKHRMLTIALDHNGRIGISLCSKKDRYNRRLGNTIAGNRLRDFDKIVLRDKVRK